MGEVYLARDTRLDRKVAIKLLHVSIADRGVSRDRFQSEARAVSSLNHPHICALYDVGLQDDRDYLVLELLQGETLARRLTRGALAPDQVLRHGVEIAEALDHAHRHGIVHRYQPMQRPRWSRDSKTVFGDYVSPDSGGDIWNRWNRPRIGSSLPG